MYLVVAFYILPLGKLYRVRLYHIDILNLGLMSDYTQLYRKYLPSSRSSSISGASYKLSKLVGLVKRI